MAQNPHELKKIVFLFIVVQLFYVACYGKEEIKANEQFEVARNHLVNNRFKASDQIFKEIVQSTKQDSVKAKWYYLIAKEYNQHLFFDLSISYAQEGLQILQQRGSLPYQIKLLEVITINHLDLGNYNLAEEYLDKVLEIKDLNNKNYAAIFLLYGEIKRLKKEPLEAKKYFRKSIAIDQLTKDTNSLIVNYNNLGLTYLQFNQLDSALYYLNLSKQFIEKLNLTIRKQAIGISFGDLYFKKGDYNKALEFYGQILNYDLAKHPDKFELLKDAYKGISLCESKLNNFQKAYEAHLAYQKFQNQIFDFKKQAAIFESQLISDRNAHKYEIATLAERINLQKRKQTMLFVLFGILILAIGLFVYTLWLRNKASKQKIELELKRNKLQELELKESHREKERLELEVKNKKQSEIINEIERKRLTEQIDAKNRELTSSAIHISNKNEILNSIQTMLVELEKNQQKDLSKSIKKIDQLIKENIQLDSDWVIFKRHFTEVHPNFFEKLSSEFDGLTSDELKLCAYLKIQLSSKEIARVLNVTSAAINKRRNRLRKKLSLQPDADLYEFLLSLS